MDAHSGLPYWLALRRAGLGSTNFSLLLKHFGTIDEAWIAPADEVRRAGLGAQFVRGGAVSSDTRMEGTGPLTTRLTAWHYDWIANDTIRMVWERDTRDDATTTLTSDWVREEYRVGVPLEGDVEEEPGREVNQEREAKN